MSNALHVNALWILEVLEGKKTETPLRKKLLKIIVYELKFQIYLVVGTQFKEQVLTCTKYI